MGWLDLWRDLPAELRVIILGCLFFLALGLLISLWWYSIPRCAICSRRHLWGQGLLTCAHCGRRFCAAGLGEERYVLTEPPDAEPYRERVIILSAGACGASRLAPPGGRKAPWCRHCLTAAFPVSGEGA